MDHEEAPVRVATDIKVVLYVLGSVALLLAVGLLVRASDAKSPGASLPVPAPAHKALLARCDAGLRGVNLASQNPDDLHPAQQALADYATCLDTAGGGVVRLKDTTEALIQADANLRDDIAWNDPRVGQDRSAQAGALDAFKRAHQEAAS